MIALGIDPGTRRIGYGLVREENGALEFITAGILKIESNDDSAALDEAKREIDAIIRQHRPEIVAVERLYFAKNQKTAIAVAQARGVILLAIQESGVPLRECTPNEVKLGVTGYGGADKKAVLKMVRLILGRNEINVIDDASDALALAILACRNRY